MLTLTATELPRFMACNGSRLMPKHALFNVDDTTRNEGNAVHWLIEQVHRYGVKTDELVDRKAYNDVFITEEMVEHATLFLNDIIGFGSVECDTSHGDGQCYQVNGRADHIFFDNNILIVSDFKYGWSIVEPEDNWTLISHAIGWLEKNPSLDVNYVMFRIYQPRPHHALGKVRVTTISLDALRRYSIRMKEALQKPTEQLNTTEHCYKCPAMATCPAAQKAGMNAIDVSETAYKADVDNVSLAQLLDQIDRALKVLEQNKKAYSELALHRLKASEIIPGYAAVKELTNRQWKAGITAEIAQVMTGVDISKKQLITPAQAAKAGVSEAAIDALCERREKGVKLTKMDADTAVKKMFKL